MTWILALAAVWARAESKLLCSQEPRLRSAGSPREVPLSFYNGSLQPLTAFWLDFEGRRRKYFTLQPYQSHTQSTFEGHLWVLADERGACMSIFEATAQNEMAVFGRPQPPWPLPKSDHVVPVREEWSFDPFYKKYLDASGIPVISSEKVSDTALGAARLIVLALLGKRRDVFSAMVRNRAVVAVMAPTEKTTDIPEHRHLAKDHKMDWNARARGLGGMKGGPLTTAGEENLLCLAKDRYRGESVLVHEFAHAILNLGLDDAQPDFRKKLERAYTQAIADGLWKNTYAGSNADEYWAEGVQSFFDTNLESIPNNGIHNSINTRKELRVYDPRLFKLLSQIFSDDQWRPRCP